MRTLTARAALALLLSFTVTSMTATSPAIGLATANGSFQVNAAKVWGNTTLFDGSVVETAKAPSDLRLNNGAQMRLASESRATVYGGRFVLERGSGQVEASSSYPVEARTLRVYPATSGAVARVELARGSQVLVAAVQGAVRVTNAAGVVVANMTAGNALSFDPQAGASAPTKVAGCLLRKDGKFVVVDQVTNVTLQVQGGELEKEVGNKVEITGAADPGRPAVAGATQLVNVQSVKRLEKGGCSSVARKVGAGAGAGAAAAAAGAAAGGAAAGIGTAATVAIVGGVVAAGTVGGLAAAGSFSGEETRPSTSR
jgi:hypothetical protein